MDLREVRKYWEGLEYCGCYTTQIEDILGRAVEVLYFVESEPDGADGGTVVRCPDGYWAITENQDYTGHGCQCGSYVGCIEAGPFRSLGMAIRLGLTRSAREALGLSSGDCVVLPSSFE